jgi:hypothetical protein
MQQPEDAPPTLQEQQQLVARILASDLFSKSHRLAAFLQFVFDQYSHGHAAAINEQRIGTAVFGRPTGYHVGEDSIVRSQARFLRQRLDEYFATAGRSEPLLLHIPKGSYVPAIERRPAAALPVTQPPGFPLPAPPVPNAAPSTITRLTNPLAALLLFAAMLLLIALLYVVLRPASPQTAHQSPAVHAFWTSVFSPDHADPAHTDPDRSVLIVPADSTLVLMEELTGKPVHLPAYINKSYLNNKPPEASVLWTMLAGSQYTSIADLNLVARLERVPEAASAHTRIRSARDLSFKELKDGNAILIGGLRANPWVALYASATNFEVNYDPATRNNLVRNRKPGANEQPLYIEDAAAANGDTRAYGVVVYLPSLDNQGHSLLVEGTSKAGTEAAAEFLTGPSFDHFLQQIGATRNAVPNFELLLSTGTMDGASYHPAVLCWHRLRS